MDIAQAKRVATRRNNKERKKLPLFAEQLPVVTPEQVLEKHAQHAAAQQQWRQKFDLFQIASKTPQKAEVAALCTPEERARFAADYAVSWYQHSFWSVVLMKIKKRKAPIPEPAELVFAWLETWEGESPTPDELHRSKGDDLSLPAIREALFWLEERN